MEAFKDRLATALKEKDISAAELSRRIKISKGSISNYLSGRYKAAQSNTYLIAKALDVSEAWLMGYDVPKQSFDILYKENGGRAIGDDEVIDPEVYNFLEVLELKLSHITDSAKREKALKALRSTLDLIEE